MPVYQAQSAFSAFRAFLPPADHSAEWSGVGVAVWRTFFYKFELRQIAIIVGGGQQVKKKSAPGGHFTLHQAVVPDFMGSIAI